MKRRVILIASATLLIACFGCFGYLGGGGGGYYDEGYGVRGYGGRHYEGLVQAALSTPATANLSEARATVDSRAALKLATSPVEGLPVVVAVEDSMVESIDE